MNKYGLLGKNISYTLSPKIHNILANYYDIDMSYEVIDVQTIDYIDLQMYKGINVTIPYKQEVLKFLDRKETYLGVVNTVINNSGELVGYNTDILGFDKFYKNNILEDVKSVLILGNGATSKMLQSYFKNLGINVIVLSRNANKDLGIYEYLEFEKFIFDICINTTPLGQGAFLDDSCLTFEQLKNVDKFKYFIDFNYRPLNTKIMSFCKMLGIKVFNGLEILVNQAVYSFGIWNEINVDEQIFEKVYLEILMSISDGILIYGMPLSGKSTIYNLYNHLEDFAWFDLDLEIEKKINISIANFVKEKGILEFRKQELLIFEEIINKFEEKLKIVTLGGGTLVDKDYSFYKSLRDYIFVYNDVPKNLLLERLNREEISKRPFLIDKSSLEEIYYKRIDFYESIYDLKLNGEDFYEFLKRTTLI